MVLGEKGRRRRVESDKIGGLWRGPPGTAHAQAAFKWSRSAVALGFGWAPLPPSNSGTSHS
jgi:hypothetical protein